MKYSVDMLLDSDSGYFFPFVVLEDEEVSVILDYGKQINPNTGEQFFHKGLDFSAKGKNLYAMATGMVTGVGSNDVHGNYIIARYGNFFVTYGHIASSAKEYGDKVKAGEIIAQSGNFLHFGVRFKGEDIDPNEFLDLINNNIMQLVSIGDNPVNFDKFRPKATTEYDKDSDSIEVLMTRYFPEYIDSLNNGSYKPSDEFNEKLRNLFVSTSSQNYFYEKMPTVANPLGLTERAAPVTSKATDLIITDFLHYVAVRHNVFPPGWSAEQKKKLFRKAMAPME